MALCENTRAKTLNMYEKSDDDYRKYMYYIDVIDLENQKEQFPGKTQTVKTTTQ